MKSRQLIAAIVLASTSSGTVSFAQGNSGNERARGQAPQRGEQQDRRDNDGRQAEQRNNAGRQEDRRDNNDRNLDWRDNNDRQRDWRDNQARQQERRDYPDRGRAFERRDERGAGPNHAYYRGSRLPAEYRGRQYVVEDWRGHSLSAPPRGYHWVQVGGDYVLIAIATGIIFQLLLGR